MKYGQKLKLGDEVGTELLVKFPYPQYEENPGGRTGYPKKY
jgi:hypothetical protein